MKRRHFATAAVVVAITGVGSYLYEDATYPASNPQNGNDQSNQTAKSGTSQIKLYSSNIGSFGLGTADACSGASCPAPTPTPTPKPTPKPTPTPTLAPVSGGAPNTPVPTPDQTSTSGQSGTGQDSTSGQSSSGFVSGSLNTDQTGSAPTTGNNTGLGAAPTPGLSGGDVTNMLNSGSTGSTSPESPLNQITFATFAAQFITRPVIIGAYILLGIVALWVAAWLGRTLQGFAEPKNMKFIKIIVGLTLVASLAALVWLITVGLL